MARHANTGKCELCRHAAAESEIVRHLVKCAPGYDAKGAVQSLVQLRFQAAGDRRYWLHLETRADATLRQVDSLLRRVWLECCGHMSAFRIGRAELGMTSKVAEVFERKRLKFDYEYDFGTTTALKGEVVGGRAGSFGRHTVRLLARNDPIGWSCAECPAPATVICSYCIDEGSCLFCRAHATRHVHAREEVYLPVVNSPRMGMCGYTG